VVLEFFVAAERRVAVLAMEGLVVHGRVPFVLFECFLAGKITIAGNTVVHSVDDSSLLFVQIVGGKTTYDSQRCEFWTC
jgi:hypothetical protein